MNRTSKKKNPLEAVKKVSPVTAGVAGAAAGAAVGAGVAVAATAAMKNKKTRQQVNKVIKDAKKQAAAYVDRMRANNVEEGKKALGKVVSNAKKRIDGNGKKSAKKQAGNKRVSASRGTGKHSPRPSSHA